MGFADIVGYKLGRNLSKLVLILAAIAVSTFATGIAWLNYDVLSFGFPIKNYIAVALIALALLVKDEIINPRPIPFIDRGMSKWVYYIILGIIALDISTIFIPFITSTFNIAFLGFAWFTIRNIIAVILLLAVRTIHSSG